MVNFSSIVTVLIIILRVNFFAFGDSNDSLDDEITSKVVNFIANRKFEEAINFINIEVNKKGKEQFIRKAKLIRLLACIMLIKGDLNQAEENFYKSLDLYKRGGKINDSFVADIYNGLASIYKQKKQFQKFIFYSEKAINIYESSHKFNNKKSLLVTIIKLAEYYANEGDFTKSEELLKRASNILEKDSFKIPVIIQSWVFKGLGNVYINKNEIETSLSFYLKGLTLLEKNFTKDYIEDILYLRHQLAKIYKMKNELREAISLYERNIKTLEEIYGKDSIEVARELQNLSGFYETIGDNKSSKDLRKRAGEIYNKHPLYSILNRERKELIIINEYDNKESSNNRR